jgi:signal recognition particle subunit SRP54
MMNFLPRVSKLSSKIGDLTSGDKTLASQIAIVNSMTKKERKNPDILNASRKKRIATGSGTTVQQVNILLKQFKQISTTMKKVSRMDPKTLLRSGIGKLFS